MLEHVPESDDIERAAQPALPPEITHGDRAAEPDRGAPGPFGRELDAVDHPAGVACHPQEQAVAAPDVEERSAGGAPLHLAQSHLPELNAGPFLPTLPRFVIVRS